MVPRTVISRECRLVLRVFFRGRNLTYLEVRKRGLFRFLSLRGRTPTQSISEGAANTSKFGMPVCSAWLGETPRWPPLADRIRERLSIS